MAITREHPNGMLHVLKTPEPPHVALVHRLVVDSHNAGEGGIDVRGLRRRIRPVLAETTHQDVLAALLALEKEGLLAEDKGSEQEFFLHTSTPGFRLEYASTAYRRAISDLHLETEGALPELLNYADAVMRAVKAAGQDPLQAGKLLERLKS